MVHVAAPALSTRGLKIFFAPPQKPVDTHNRRVYIGSQMQRGTGSNHKETDMNYELNSAITTIYTIPAPDRVDTKIEVYGDPSNAWYEWRIIDTNRIIRDTGTEGSDAFQGSQYGQPEIALRDALMFATGLPIAGDYWRTFTHDYDAQLRIITLSPEEQRRHDGRR